MSTFDFGIMKTLVLSICLIGLCFCRPPIKEQALKSDHNAQPHQNQTKEDWDLGIEYNRYLQEVVQVLESDPEFRNKLETADVDAIRDGTIAHELEFVNHGIRTKLDDIKRRELERLRHLIVKQNELSQGIDKKHMKIPQHLEIRSPRFEIDDLQKLIKSTTQDLEEADKNRREDFKRYEMEKKYEEEERLKHIEDELKRDEEKKRFDEIRTKHKDHGKVHHPLTKDQLEEVWEDQDHMRAQDWNPKTFFAMHDLNGDNHWDEDEVRVLFRKELDKVYDPNEPEDDMRERQEEMERMREHVFSESDTNRDRLISYDEFFAETKRDEFGQDPGWETMDMEDNDIFTDDEFRAYQAQREREIQGMLNRGVVPPGYPYYGNVPPGAQPYEMPHPAVPGGVPGSIPGQPAFKPDQGFPQPGIQPSFQQHPAAQGGFGQQPMGQQPQMRGGQPHPMNPGQPQFNPGQPQFNPGQPQLNQGQPQFNQGQPQFNQGQPQLNQRQPQANQGQPQFNQGQPQFNQGQPQFNQGQPQQVNQGQPQGGQPQLNQGQIQPNQALPGGQQPPQFHQDLKAPEPKQP